MDFQILSSVTGVMFVLLQITFFDDKNFAGSSCAATTDQPAQLNSCNSVKVENGCWMVYEHPNYTGHQFFLRKGEYPDNQPLCRRRVVERTVTKFTL
uniref:Beta/gamma crystallin 'Greek key' domain-containing protein n=1 Tax=Calidris pygmaea TaxID=425635 RepID=A0A8C3J8H1_9CHAR